MTKAEEQAAYAAGKHSVTITWGPDATDEQQVPGIHHCPFAVGDPQRTAWLKGLEDGLGGDRFDPATILREIKDELRLNDRVAKAVKA